MPILLILVAVAALCAVAVVLAGRDAPTPDPAPDRAPFDLPDDRALTADDVVRVRFAVGFRGYRMEQVDAVLERLTDELADRDRRLAALTGADAPGEDVPGNGAAPGQEGGDAVATVGDGPLDGSGRPGPDVERGP